MNAVNKEDILAKVKETVDGLSKIKLSSCAPTFVQKVFENGAVAELLILLSRLPVFSKEFSSALSHDLDLLALGKKLK
jgi:hypothetical protein